MSDFEVKVQDVPDDGKGLQRIQEETLRLAIEVQGKWADNLSTGTGQGGSHGRPYVNTGEAVASIQLDPETPDSDEYVIFSDRIQVLIAEVGRVPGSRMPPEEPISQWVQEQLGIPWDDPEHDGIVWGVRRNIAKFGLEPFFPMEKAIIDTIADLEKRYAKAMNPQ